MREKRLKKNFDLRTKWDRLCGLKKFLRVKNINSPCQKLRVMQVNPTSSSYFFISTQSCVAQFIMSEKRSLINIESHANISFCVTQFIMSEKRSLINLESHANISLV